MRLLDKDRKAILEYSAVKPQALESTLWQAAGINNGRGGVVSTATTRLATARFEDGKVSGHAGCNTFNASYEITDDRISMGPAMTTRMHCAKPDGIMDQEQEYLAALSRARVFELTDNGLKLRDANGSLQVKEPLMCRHCEEQSDEAICNSLIHWLRDCFASLAMTGYMN